MQFCLQKDHLINGQMDYNFRTNGQLEESRPYPDPKVIKDIGTSEIKFDAAFLEIIENMIKEKEYLETMLYVAQHTASMQRDELHRVLTICEYHNLSTAHKANIIKNLNDIESGNCKFQ